MEWKEYKLRDVITVKYGKDHKQLAEGEIPIYGSGGIMRFGNKYLYDGPSILIPRKGSLNNIMYSDKPFWTVDTMFWTIINEDIVNPQFLYYSIYKKDFASLNVGSAVPSLTVPVIEDITVNLPPREIQDKIVSILKSLDDKIENNRKINENLEQQAQALFKSWFVDFEPFRDQPFVDSELGMIPEGWRVGKIKELPLIVADYVANGSFASLKENVKLYNEPNYAIFIRNTDLKTKEFHTFVDKHSYEFLSKSTLYGGEIIISNVGDVGSVFLCPKLNEKMTLGNNIIMLKLEDSDFQYFLYILFKWSYGQGLIQGIKGGSAQPKFNKGDFKSLSIIIPNQMVLRKFQSIISSLFEKIENNNLQSYSLAELRDTLLPKLMTGEINLDNI